MYLEGGAGVVFCGGEFGFHHKRHGESWDRFKRGRDMICFKEVTLAAPQRMPEGAEQGRVWQSLSNLKRGLAP